MPRVHLVMDLVVNDFIRGLFPPGYAEAAGIRAAYRRAHWFLYDRRTELKQRVKRLVSVDWLL
jgi:hypothetical protein